jgi:hypothetical protein
LGFNRRYHPFDKGGFELTYQVTGTFFNLVGGNTDAFQNALGAVQGAYVFPIGHQQPLLFMGMPTVWATLQGSVFANVAAGLGTNYDGPTDNRKVYLGFLVQPSAGAMLTATLGHVQVSVGDSIVYSWLSPTTQAGSKATSNVGNQVNLGLGWLF